MKNLFKSVIVAGVILVGSTAMVENASATFNSEYEELLKDKVQLQWYTVNKVEKNYKFTAIDPVGKKLVFDDSDIASPKEVKKWSRVRAYVQKGKVTTVEVVKPTLVEYKITKITSTKKSKSYSATSKKAGGIVIPSNKMEGKVPKVGETVVVEFDQRFIEAGFIKAYKK